MSAEEKAQAITANLSHGDERSCQGCSVLALENMSSTLIDEGTALLTRNAQHHAKATTKRHSDSYYYYCCYYLFFSRRL